MVSEDLINKVADKAIADGISKQELEWLFKPLTLGELMCRLLGVEQFHWIIGKAATIDTPTAMPHRFRGPYIKYAFNCMDHEMLYQAIKQKLEASNNNGQE